MKRKYYYILALLSLILTVLMIITTDKVITLIMFFSDGLIIGFMIKSFYYDFMDSELNEELKEFNDKINE